jgi:hypothetical protein
MQMSPEQERPMSSQSNLHLATSSPSDHFGHLREWLTITFKPKPKCVIERSVTRALSLKPRGAVAHDVLTMSKLSGQIQVEWVARDIHPWDRDQPEEEKSQLFLQQCLGDVDVAIARLFYALPEIDAIEIRVMHPMTKSKLIEGTVNRATLLSSSGAPIAVKLSAMGLHFRRSNGGFEPLP